MSCPGYGIIIIIMCQSGDGFSQEYKVAFYDKGTLQS